MAGETHRFCVGELTCLAILDGGRPINSAEAAHEYFPSVPLADLRAVFDAQTDKEHEWAFSPLIIDTGSQKVLVDTGNGMVDGQPGGLMRGLAAEGIQAEDIDLVFITHAHGDHINGLAGPHGSAAFPNARYAIGRVEWNYWAGGEEPAGVDPARVAAVRATLDIMRGRLTLVDPGDAITPGITAVEAYGHTPGHMALLVESAGQRLLHIVDIVHMVIQVTRPGWSPRFDSLPELSPVTRRSLLQRAVDEQLLTFSFHLPFPGLARIESAGEGFSWKPLS